MKLHSDHNKIKLGHEFCEVRKTHIISIVNFFPMSVQMAIKVLITTVVEVLMAQ